MAYSTLLLAIEDVTQRRDAELEKDELLRQKEVLVQEMQHRVANSLQIIATILLLKARTVQSEETRLHLRDAHERVMSLATVQQQLRASRLGDRIEVGPYLSKLCDSLAKSMIGDRRPLSLIVQATAGTGIQRGGEHRADHHGVGHQRAEACVPSRPTGDYRFPITE